MALILLLASKLTEICEKHYLEEKISNNYCQLNKTYFNNKNQLDFPFVIVLALIFSYVGMTHFEEFSAIRGTVSFIKYRTICKLGKRSMTFSKIDNVQ